MMAFEIVWKAPTPRGQRELTQAQAENRRRLLARRAQKNRTRKEREARRLAGDPDAQPLSAAQIAALRPKVVAATTRVTDDRYTRWEY